MPLAPGPVVTRRRLRTELRKLREDAGLSLESVTNDMEWSLSKLIRIENGSVGISANDLKALLRLYELTNPDRTAELLDLARASKQRMWWSKFRQHLTGAYLEFIGYEADASAIRQFHPTTVPGLLQTEGYARAINAMAPKMAIEGAEARLQVRMTRQREILRREDPPEFTAVIDEAVLHRPVGGTAAMRRQLDHLAAQSARPNITLIVVPFQAGEHPGMGGPFTLLEFPDPADADVLYLENTFTNVIQRDERETIDHYRRAFDRLTEIGVSGGDAVNLIQRVRKERS